MTRTFAFGDLDARLWAIGWSASGEDARVVVGSDAGGAELPARLVGSEQDEWRVEGTGIELALAPTGHGLCRARGHVALRGGRDTVDCLGWRQTAEAPPAEWSTLRLAAMWFSPEEGIALRALRGKGSGGHGDDEVSAEVFGLEPGVVEDPRLSTTYTRDGRVSRAGIELWIAPPEGEELRVLRAAGEAVGAPAQWGHNGASCSVSLLRWHSRGLEGAGVYLLARRR